MRYEPRWHRWTSLTVAEVSELFTGCEIRWWLSGGWAIDHSIGAVSREHDDIDISTLRAGLPALIERLPAGMQSFAAMDGQLLPLKGQADLVAGMHNIWVRNDKLGRFVLQINVESGDAEAWRYRRDPRIFLPWDTAVRSIQCTPTATPATQLLWKAKRPRPRDEHDLDIVHTMLRPAERRWLRESIRMAHPESPWLDDSRI
jgi:hypothetical protein